MPTINPYHFSHHTTRKFYSVDRHNRLKVTAEPGQALHYGLELEDEWSAADADNSVKKTLCWVEYQIVHGTKSHPAYGDCFQDSFSWDWEDTVATAKFNREGLSPYDRAHQIVSAQRVEIEVEVEATPEEAYNDWTLACVGNADYVEFIDSAR